MSIRNLIRNSKSLCQLSLALLALVSVPSLAQQEKLRIGITLHPYYSFVANIVGNLAEVVPLIDGGTVRLPRIVGQGCALDMILTGRPVPAQEALAMGLAMRKVSWL